LYSNDIHHFENRIDSTFLERGQINTCDIFLCCLLFQPDLDGSLPTVGYCHCAYKFSI
jgi:hypothetical protein